MPNELTLKPEYCFIATESRLLHRDLEEDIKIVIDECSIAGYYIHEAIAAWAWELYSTTKRARWANPKKKSGGVYEAIKKFVMVKNEVPVVTAVN